jgi:hypothetical protein
VGEQKRARPFPPRLCSANAENARGQRKILWEGDGPRITRISRIDFAAEALIRAIRVIRGPNFPILFSRRFLAALVVAPLRFASAVKWQRLYLSRSNFRNKR